MANLLQSSQTQATTAPTFYTDYLSNLASQGKTAVQQAQFAGEQPLQTKAFEQAPEAVSSYKPTLGQAGDVLTQAASAPSPLTAAEPYLWKAGTNDPAEMAAGYMNPYVKTAVQSLSDIAQRNIRQNLAPGATAAAVGSGQFGSQRGAQVLGQVEAQAEQDLNNQIAQMLSTGYGQALTAAGQQQNLLANLGNISGQLESVGQQNLTQAGGALSSLAGQEQGLGLAGINALATLGGQQQTIAQNKENYPLTKLASLAALLQGQQIPSTVTTQLQMSPFSALGTLGTAGLGLITPNAQGVTPLQNIKGALSNLFPSIGQIGTDASGNPVYEGNPGGATNTNRSGWTDNGDGTYTTSTGQVIDSSGNPVEQTGAGYTDYPT